MLFASKNDDDYALLLCCVWRTFALVHFLRNLRIAPPLHKNPNFEREKEIKFLPSQIRFYLWFRNGLSSLSYFKRLLADCSMLSDELNKKVFMPLPYGMILVWCHLLLLPFLSAACVSSTLYPKWKPLQLSFSVLKILPGFFVVLFAREPNPLISSCICINVSPKKPLRSQLIKCTNDTHTQNAYYQY